MSNITKDTGSVNGKRYSRYLALISQGGSADPEELILENGLSATHWARDSAGVYICSFTGNVLTSGKTVCFATNQTNLTLAYSQLRANSTTDAVLVNCNKSAAAIDNFLTLVEIRVYE